jgi:hypothetical protein
VVLLCRQREDKTNYLTVQSNKQCKKTCGLLGFYGWGSIRPKRFDLTHAIDRLARERTESERLQKEFNFYLAISIKVHSGPLPVGAKRVFLQPTPRICLVHRREGSKKLFSSVFSHFLVLCGFFFSWLFH